MNTNQTHPKARIISASTALQNKVGTGAVDTDLIAKAQVEIDQNEVDFAELAKNDLKTLKENISNGKSMLSKGHTSLPNKDFLVPIMNIKANAGSFHYQLVSDISGQILSNIETNTSISKDELDAIELLYKTILIVMTKKITGQGGKEGRELKRGFQELCHSLTKMR